ncbi:MAG: zinc dependent phospholipase C family protein [Sedimentibacter sp.]
MPPISTNMHFGKIFIENSEDEIDMPSFIIGIVSPDTINEDDFEELHSFDEDGNMDVREFYEQFNFKKLNIVQKSFVLGYYCHLWFDEYYKFNASKLTIHNNLELSDKELGVAVKNILRCYDYKAINNFFEKYTDNINEFNFKINLKEINGVNIKKSKEKIQEFLRDKTSDIIYPQLIEEDEYMRFIKNGCSKIMKSL